MSDRIPRVLLAEDDELLARTLSRALRSSGLATATVGNGLAVIDAVRADRADVVLLDLGLPDLDGLAVLAQVRAIRPGLPVIVLTGRSTEGERIAGLDLGADDYVVKPAYPGELAARIRAVLRRGTPAASPAGVHVHGDLEVDEAARTVTVSGAPLDLPPMEFDLLVHLVRRVGRACSRDELLREVWGTAPGLQDAATVTEHVGRLRRRLGPGSRGHRIATVRGVGYRFSA